MMDMLEIVRYLLQFMIGENHYEEISHLVGYCSDSASFQPFKVVIVPSDFFKEGVYGSNKTNPSIPLKHIDGVPLLFGTPDIERVGDTIVVHADLVASAYFLVSRYEEMLHRHLRDAHGRFPGRESLPYRAGFIDRPIVEEYGQLIRKWLKQNGVTLSEPAAQIRKINLTHDVDEPFYCRTWRNVARHLLSGRSLASAIRAKYGPVERDLYFTFPWMLHQDNVLQLEIGEDRCQSFLFFKAGGKTKKDKPYYHLDGKDIRVLLALCREHRVIVGLHSSYSAGMTPSFIATEKKQLETTFGMEIKHNRHHYLSSREPEEMEYLEQEGFTDDYTMGYADVSGFRLGTSLPVRYINCQTRRLTSLTLHPLIIMDGTLNHPNYMNLTAEKAEAYCFQLIQRIQQVNGDLTLLWHNTSVVEGAGYLRDLYRKIIIGIRSQESGVRSQESGVRSQESGVRSQESGVRSQESGIRSQESGINSPFEGGRGM